MSERLLVHPTSVTGTIDRLEAQDLVKRVPNPTDRRGILVRITPKGRRAAEEAIRRVGETRFGLRGWSDADLRSLSAMLQRIRRDFHDPVEEDS